ncbi:hypothetical protein NOCA2790032 [metagenome]|uniref:DUF1707 domain-containing protein n=1 Tax=metagenome TaxID=256318 RepID=A0A2P2CHL3_9ZZZZ
MAGRYAARVSYPDPHLRARDSDRDRTVEAIEAAYVDGQITPEDRDLRVGNALTAASLGELAMLVRDLQVPAATLSPPPSFLPPSSPPGQGRARSPRALVPVLLVVAALVMLALVGGGLALVGTGQPSTQVARSADQVPAVVEQEPSGDTFRMTPAGVRRFVADYQEQFGSPDVLQATLYADHRILVEVPVAGHPRLHENWTYRGAFTQDGGATVNAFQEKRIDLRALDVNRLFANISRAERSLRVPAAAFTHVGLSNIWSDEQPAVNIHVSNDVGMSGYLKTGLDGQVIRAYSFE